MMRPLYLSLVLVTTVLQLTGCDDNGAQDESAAARARDSSLAHDLQIATADSAGLGGAPEGTDSARIGAIPPMVEGKGSAGAAAPRVVPAMPASNPSNATNATNSRNASNSASGSNTASATVTESPGAISAAPARTRTPAPKAAVLPKASAGVSADDYAGTSCASPALADQRRCLMSYLARSDVGLDRNYQSLISALKREGGSQAAGREPATVLRLRTAQRNWLVYRDDECRRQNAATEGPLWAPTRAKCLAEYSEQRSRELANALSERASAKSSKAKAASKPTSASRSKAAKRTKQRRS